MTAVVRLRAYAKVNLYLAVERRRDDGFHEITTVLHNVDLADALTVERREEVELRLDGSGADRVPGGDENLVCRAARAMGTPGWSITLTKRIPVAAGLGGGSADAAAALIGLSSLGAPEGARGVAELAPALGSDVPFFLLGGTAVARGRGEKLDRIDSRSFWFVLGVFEEGLSTRSVYAAWERYRGDEAITDSLDLVQDALRRGDAAALGSHLRNDLERAAMALRPRLAAARDALLDAGALGAAVSGSGPTLFAVAGSRSHAEDIAARARPAFDEVMVVTSAPLGVEVVNGDELGDRADEPA